MTIWDPGLEDEAEGDSAVEERKKSRRPRRWRVLLHNDDFTSMEFVVHILTTHFKKPPAEATFVMLQVHHKGVGVAGIYPRDVAETKIAEATDEAREQGMPLKLTLEPDGDGQEEDRE